MGLYTQQWDVMVNPKSILIMPSILMKKRLELIIQLME